MTEEFEVGDTVDHIHGDRGRVIHCVFLFSNDVPTCTVDFGHETCLCLFSELTKVSELQLLAEQSVDWLPT
jgi:hypothetical protein